MSSLNVEGDGKSRRRSLSVLFGRPPSPAIPKAEKPPHVDEFRVNFHFVKIDGIPISRLQQYRISVKLGDDKKPITSTSWKLSNAKGFLIEQTPKTFCAATFSRIVFKVESRFERQSTIGESDVFTISDLMKQQNSCGHRDPVNIQLTSRRNPGPITLQLTIRSLPVARELEALSRDRLRDDEGEKIAQVLHANYPDTVSKAVKALDCLVSTLASSPVKFLSINTQQLWFDNLERQIHMSCFVTSELVHQMWKDIQERKRKKMPYAVEDFIWMFLNEVTKETFRVEQAAQKTSTLSSEHVTHLLSNLLRGFWLLCQLHEPQGSNLDNQQQGFIKVELRRIAKSFPYKPKPRTTALPKPDLLSTRYPELEKLNDVSTKPSRRYLVADDSSLCHSTTFQEIVRWMSDANIDRQIFWLHGKSETGPTKSQVATQLMEACKNIGIPIAYHSFAQTLRSPEGKSGSNDGDAIVKAMLGSMIYQLSLCDTSFADAFHLAIKETEEFHTKDSYARFQLLLLSLFSMSYPDQLKAHPTLLVIDDLEPSTSVSPSAEYDRLLQLLSSASRSSLLASPPSSPPASPSLPSPASSYSSIQDPQRSSLPFPPFLRIIVLSRSLGSNPSLIEQFAHIRDGHGLVNSPRANDLAAKLYNSAVGGGGKGKGKGKARAKSLDSAPLMTIAEADSRGSVGSNQ